MSQQTLKDEVRSVGRHSLIYMLGPAFSKIVGFLLIPIYTRFIAPDQFGVMALVDVFMTMTMMVLTMGVADSLARFYYDQEDDLQRRRMVTTVVLGPALLTLPVILVITLGAGHVNHLLGIGSDYVIFVRLAALTAWFSMLTEIGYAYLRLRYLSATFLAVTLIQILASVGLNLLLVVGFRLGIWGILSATLIVQAALGATLAIVITIQARAWPSWSHLKQLLGFGLPLVPGTVTLQLSNYLTPLMIRWLMVGDPTFLLAQVGLFSAGQKIGVVVNRFVTVPFNAFWRPRRMELVVQDNPHVKAILARICTYAALISAQVALLLSVMAEDLLKLFLDVRYWDAYRIVPLVACAYVVLGLEHHFSIGMHYARKTLWATWIGLASLLAIVAINILLLPRFGIVSAALASLLGVSLRSGLFLMVSQRLYPIPFELRRLATVVICAGLLFLLSRQIHIESVELSLLVRMLFGLGLVPMLWASRFFRPGEREALRGFLSRQALQPR